MATPAEIRDAIQARLAAVWPQLTARQDAYFTAKGRYWQGRRTHAVAPADGAAAPADRLSDRPTDQAEDWTAFGVGAWTEAFALEIHCYRGPGGNGWVARAVVTLGGRTWERWRGQGPEDRDVPWADVIGVP